MARRFRAAGGKVAVWEGETDTLPFTNPLTYLNRVKFHSDLSYVKIVATKTFTKTIPAITGYTPERAQSYTLGAHGRTGQPFIIGRIVVNGVPVAFTGSVLVHQVAGDSFGRWLALGADATNIYLHEYAVQSCYEPTARCDSRPSQTFTITCYITDILL